MILGKMPIHEAELFVSKHWGATLGSKSADGAQRVKGPPELRLAFEEAGGILNGPQTFDAAAEICLPCQQSALGDRIKEKLILETGDQAACGDCQAEVERLNQMTREQALAEIPALSHRMVERAQTQATSFMHRAAARIAPGLTAAIVQDWMQEAVLSDLPEINQMVEHLDHSPDER